MYLLSVTLEIGSYNRASLFLQSEYSLSRISSTMKSLLDVLNNMTELEEEELFVENDFIYISVEKKPAYKWLNQTVDRSRTAVELISLLERNPKPGNSSSVTLKVSDISSAKLFTE